MSEDRRCPRCGAPAEPSQRVCLRCGSVVPGGGDPGRPRNRLWPVLFLALVSAGATAATIAAHTTKKSAASTTVATSPHVSVTLPTTATTTAPAQPTTTSAGPQPTVTTGTLPVAPGPPSTAAATTAPPPTTTAAPTTTTAPPAAPAIGSWPSGRSGYTVVLQSLPASEGRDAALAQAHHALAAGLADVGVLLSSDFSSLRAGYWVIYAGEFSSSGAAQSAASSDRGHGFSGAYPARIAG